MGRDFPHKTQTIGFFFQNFCMVFYMYSQCHLHAVVQMCLRTLDNVCAGVENNKRVQGVASWLLAVSHNCHISQTSINEKGTHCLNSTFAATVEKCALELNLSLSREILGRKLEMNQYEISGFTHCPVYVKQSEESGFAVVADDRALLVTSYCFMTFSRLCFSFGKPH